jgi:uncharacterized protein (DUF1015 family)
MAKIFPLKAWRYAPEAGPVDKLLTQPYDKISPAMQQRYYDANPHNLVRIILGRKQESDSESDNVYTRGAALFADWTANGILKQDPTAAFYAYFQEFTLPDSGETLVRKGFIGLGQVEPYENNIVYRHELTLAGPKKDRLQVLAHTHAHFGQIFMLYPDREMVIDRILDDAAAGAPACRVVDEYNATHTLWPITDARKSAAIQEAMEDKKLLIADGHHRYETSLNFHASHPEMQDARRVMMTFVNMYSPGLRILGTHRVVKNIPEIREGEFLTRMKAHFTVHEHATVDKLRAAWAKVDQKHTVAIGVVLRSSDRAWLLEAPRQAGDLDVKVLHAFILQEALGISEEAIRDEKHLKYIRGIDAAVKEVREADGQAAFLLEPPSIDQVADISFSGGVMPQKSTDFYPKLLTGMAIYRLEK